MSRVSSGTSDSIIVAGRQGDTELTKLCRNGLNGSRMSWATLTDLPPLEVRRVTFSQAFPHRNGWIVTGPLLYNIANHNKTEIYLMFVFYLHQNQNEIVSIERASYSYTLTIIC